jgi:hypothetical protein
VCGRKRRRSGSCRAGVAKLLRTAVGTAAACDGAAEGGKRVWPSERWGREKGRFWCRLEVVVLMVFLLSCRIV